MVGPLYNKIAFILRERIESGSYANLDYLPQERVLAQELEVSRSTIRGALDLLVREKMIAKVQGRGNMILRRGEHEDIQEFIILTYSVGGYSQFVLSILNQIESHALMRDAEVCYMNLDDDSDKALQKLQSRLCKRKKNLGLLLVGCYSRPLLCKFRDTFDWPMVLIGDVFKATHRLDEPLVSQVVGNDYSKMYCAVERLLEEGCRHPGIIGEPMNEIWGSAYYQGCVDAFRDLKVEFSDRYFVTMDGYQDIVSASRNITNLLTRLLELTPRLDALIFPAELTVAVKMYQTFYPQFFPADFPMIGLSFDGEAHEFPCLAVQPEVMIREAFQILDEENKLHAPLCCRKVINSSWLQEVSPETLKQGLPKELLA